jgi:trimethylamine---corrinoid protein Co-methyltransferase
MWSPCTLLDQSQILKIHNASLQVLERVGMEINHPLAVDRLGDAGARVDKKKNRAYFPAELVDKALKSIPKQFTLGARDPQYDLHVAHQEQMPITRMCAGPLSMFNMVTNQERPMTLKDNIDAIKLVSALDHIDIAATMSPHDLPKATYDIHVMKAALTHTRKHFWGLTVASENLKVQLEMLEAVAGSRENLQKRPLASGIFCIINPLKIPADEIERLLLYGKYQIPVRMPVAPTVGANAPFTLAGAMAQTNAEFLGGITVQQVLCPEIPCWYYGGLQVMDMQKGNSISDGPESLLLSSTLCQLARFYDIPCCVNSPIVSSWQSHQAILQLGQANLFSTMVQSTEIGGFGGLQGGTHFSQEALVLADEIVAFSKRLQEGFEINEETLAVDAIITEAEKGQYLTSPHTMKFLRQESRFAPNLLDWRSFEASRQDPETIIDRAHTRAKKMLDAYEGIPLDNHLHKELDAMVQKADETLAG